jgi:hypothetical protein
MELRIGAKLNHPRERFMSGPIGLFLRVYGDVKLRENLFSAKLCFAKCRGPFFTSDFAIQY